MELLCWRLDPGGLFPASRRSASVGGSSRHRRCGHVHTPQVANYLNANMHFAVNPALVFFGITGPAKIPLSMLVIFVSAKLMAELPERIGQPRIIGEILA